MTKEQTYAQLLVAVKENEKQYDALKQENEVKKVKMRDMKISNDNRRNITKPPMGDERAMEAYDNQMRALENTADDQEAKEAEYARLQREMQTLGSELESIQERKRNMQLINDQIGGWTRRVAAKMHEQINGLPQAFAEDKPIVQIFRVIEQLSLAQLADIKQRQAVAEEEEEDVGDKEYMNDFVSEDYVTKNIRVMPMGGVSIDNQSEHTSRYMMGSHAADSDVEDSKHHQEAYHQMMDARQQVKERKLEAERKAQEAAEREAK